VFYFFNANQGNRKKGRKQRTGDKQKYQGPDESLQDDLHQITEIIPRVLEEPSISEIFPNQALIFFLNKIETSILAKANNKQSDTDPKGV